MKAIRIHHFGEPSVLQVEEITEPVPGPGQVRVQFHAAGINPVETYIRSGKYARLPELPYTPGTDGAGRIAALGEGAGVEGAEVGDRVYVNGSITGTYAEVGLCEAKHVHPLAEAISFAQGAALGVPFATAYRALFQRARAVTGETVLIHGGTGGVGLAAIQWARQAGLTVFATGGSDAGRQLLQQQGVDRVFDHTVADYAQEILEATGGKGVPVILEMLANANLSRDLKLLAPKGRVAVIGSRGPVEIDPRETMAREADIRGVMLGGASEEELAEIHTAIGAGLRAGTLLPVVAEQYPLAEAPAAHTAVMAGGSRGKVVLVM